MGNLAFQDVDFLLTDIQRSTPNREFVGLQSVQEPTKAVQFIGWVGVVHKPMIGGWPLFHHRFAAPWRKLTTPRHPAHLGWRSGRPSKRRPRKWRSIKVTEFERRQLSGVRQELDQEYEAQVGLKRQLSKDAASAKISSDLRT